MSIMSEEEELALKRKVDALIASSPKIPGLLEEEDHGQVTMHMDYRDGGSRTTYADGHVDDSRTGSPIAAHNIGRAKGYSPKDDGEKSVEAKEAPADNKKGRY